MEGREEEGEVEGGGRREEGGGRRERWREGRKRESCREEGGGRRERWREEGGGRREGRELAHAHYASNFTHYAMLVCSKNVPIMLCFLTYCVILTL